MMPAASTSAPRPGAAHAIDVAVASLLLQGDEVSPAAGEPSQRHLHALLPHAAASRAKAAAQVDDTDSADDGVISDPEECLVQEDRIETRLAQLKRVLGMGHDRTLKAAFKLMDCLIGQYKLNKTDEILRDFEKTCAERGGDWKVKWIQSTAFCRWKQYDFKEALRLFLQQQEIVGASAALCENIGHTYSSLGDLPQAEAYFERAIELLKRGSFGNRGGIYMGLGIVRDRLGKTRESLPILQQALEHYQKEHTSAGHVQLDSSIIAKAHMSLGRAHEKLGELGPAAKHMADALAIFRRTVGADSPLTANSMACLGKVKAARGEIPEAISLIKSALKLEVRKDAFHLETVRRDRDVHSLSASFTRERRAFLRIGVGAALPPEGAAHGGGQAAGARSWLTYDLGEMYIGRRALSSSGGGRRLVDRAARAPARHTQGHIRAILAAGRGGAAALRRRARARRARHARRLLQDRGRDCHVGAGLRARQGAAQRGAAPFRQGASRSRSA
jgi:tetratricopeptide (TPR) repeat protein